MKLGIIVDSASGLSKDEASKKGWGYLPLYMTIDGKDYADGVDILPKDYYKMLDVNMDVKTSATPPAIIEDVLTKASNKYDNVIVYTISEELSSQTSNIKMFAKEYKNVYVLDSKGVGYGIVSNCESLVKKAKENLSIEDIVKLGNELTNHLYGFALPETLAWLVKGGRVSSGVASMANMLKIIPIIEFKNGRLEKGGKGRTFKKTLIKQATILHESLKGEEVEYVLLEAGNEKSMEYASELKELLNKDVRVVPFPPVIVNHIGKGAIAFLSIKK